MNAEYTDKFLATMRVAATDPTPDETKTVLYRLYDAIIKGDFDAVGEFLADDVELNICGFPAIDGSWRGRDHVVAAAIRNFGHLENQQPKVEAMISHGDSTAVLMCERGVLKSTKQAYSIRAVQWFTFQNGKVKKVDQIAAPI